MEPLTTATVPMSSYDPTAVLPGTVIRPGDASYDDARRLWNGMIDRRPALIVRCRDAQEVRAAVVAARARGLPVAVRGGGHNAAGLALCDDGLVIDLSQMRGVTVDPDARTARVEGGATWADVDAATQAHGLAVTGGAISTTGVGGLTLGGGIGWLMRRQGLACDNLVAAELVTADGHAVRASDHENPDLLWGLRGGGGNFGVVTAFTFRLQPLDGVVSGLLVHPLARAKEVLRFYREFTRSAPDTLTVFAGLLTSPEGAPICALIPSWCGPAEEAEAALRPLREFGPPLADLVQPMPYVAQQRLLDDGMAPSGFQVYWRGEFLRALTDETIDALVDAYAAATSPLSVLVIEQMGGAVARVPRDATAFPNRDAAFNLAMVGRWTDPAERDVHVRWVRDVHDAVRPSALGSYVNYLGVEEGADRVRGAYGDATYARLVALKNAWDPENVFRFNQNVAPNWRLA
ncbi:FAD linked oxidase domain-containing protein (plasmid) [Gemmatirosa kalamazoonensis]|uniref:FAD linked oxidase domain-containing protein n=1 Tax=Gemmatirosa kalamazoonensis TaxID=861299 RepID=W0RVQ5_9BACT|nr:FAD-binding oxidoreductase [Gemmatirosa kalamazoonensis]AHG93663.1 FAD linked oxidase domain-containing protein [Gemmatirosa kalamazoonensis]